MSAQDSGFLHNVTAGAQTAHPRDSSQPIGGRKTGTVWATWHIDAESRLVIKREARVGLRLAVGLPILAVGLFMVWNFVSAPVFWFLADGWQGVVTGAPGMVVTGLLSLCFAPIGWYLTFARPSVVVDVARREIQDIYDWRIGRKVRHYDSRLFQRVRVSCEVLNDPSDRTSRVRFGNIVRLMARPTDTRPSLDLALFDDDETSQPVELGTLVATMLGIPVEIDFERIRSAGEDDEDVPDEEGDEAL